MGEITGIAWTDHTFNPWEGCQRVSPGCENCYAEARNARFHPELVGLPEDMPRRTGRGLHWGPPSTSDRLLRTPAYWTHPAKWNREAATEGRRRRVFCASLADVFEDHPGIERERARLFDAIEHTPHLDWQLLTKRPENMRRLAPSRWRDGWPPNVWAGTTVEDQRRADERLPILFGVPARIRFVSCEPLLEEVDLDTDEAPLELGWLHWVIVGGESGAKARPFDIEWAYQIQDSCGGRGVPLFVKQLGDRPVFGGAAFPSRAHHGTDTREWPLRLRVQEFPG